MIEQLARKTGLDISHIRQHADEQFDEIFMAYNKALIDEVYEWVHMNGGLDGRNDYSALLEHLGMEQ